MTLPPPPGSPFPRIGGRRVDLDPSAIDDDRAHTVRDRLFEERVVLVTGLLDDTVANRVVVELMTLDASGDDAVRLHLDCKGSTLEAALTVMDVVDALGVDVETLCTGQAVGPSVAVVAVANHRLALPHARFELSEPRIEIAGRPSDVELAMEHHGRRLALLHERLSEATGREVNQIALDMQRGLRLDTEEAKAYGILDATAQPEARVLEFPRVFGFGRRR